MNCTVYEKSFSFMKMKKKTVRIEFNFNLFFFFLKAWMYRIEDGPVALSGSKRVLYAYFTRIILPSAMG